MGLLIPATSNENADWHMLVRDIGDARVELEETLLNPSATSLRLAGAALTQTDRKSKRKRAVLPWAVAGLLAVGGSYAAWSAWLKPEPRPEPKRLLRGQLADGEAVIVYSKSDGQSDECAPSFSTTSCSAL